ncbi:HD-GYP domain-containing protein [Carboxydothermus ferrireducens]|uniref:HD-GYP domain-containing protein (C-di-GMP phosphodiesterase class II) n=2 Tax=Carboxydothermus TaxID=129957 RepID=A0ABX2RBT4_9THEO|nr:HD domain-containing phosphohydrolase [Carboxydothermus ferrireducens]NYE58619.1 HD-GYP domain-containing protein (c-di-GMP phosphodiesterase class II) [Carboxydothermus ferrireducens DSM 11255]
MTIKVNFFNFFNLIKNMFSAFDANELGLNKHHWKVAYVSYLVGDKLGLTEFEKNDLIYLGMIHDIGVLPWGKDEQLINFFEEEEFEHCLRGYNFLKNTYFDQYAPVILSHHDHFQGKNKTGLAGKEIPLFSRIIYLADRVAFFFQDNMHPLLVKEKVVEKIVSGKNILFDPEIVDVFLVVAETEDFWLTLGDGDILNQCLNIHPGQHRWLELDEVISIAQLFAKIIDHKSHFTFYHSQLIAEVAKFAGEIFGFDLEVRKALEVAGLLHDLGKLTVPEEILEKPAALSREEFSVIKQHTFYTYYWLIDVFPEEIVRTAAFHHEKLDGSGYPFKKKGEEISLQERLLGVVDMFVALTEDRPYRKGLKYREVKEILFNEVRANRIDRECVKILLDSYPEIITRMQRVLETEAG